MREVTISAGENAYADGSECASEWIDRDDASGESSFAWSARCRANIVSDYESGARSAICPAETDLIDFQQLLAEWDRGFGEAMARGTNGAAENGGQQWPTSTE